MMNVTGSLDTGTLRLRRIADSGIPEVVLLGQTVNSYNHGEWDFPRLLRAVARIEGIRRVRFTSPHPNDVTPALDNARQLASLTVD
jgi:tRNA-2-methylthio-N6-dimethylallyladenosine synthase